MASLFRSPDDLSSSSDSDSAGADCVNSPEAQEPEVQLSDMGIQFEVSEASAEQSSAQQDDEVQDVDVDADADAAFTADPDPDLAGLLDLNAEGHAAVMTSALLEYYCDNRAVEILNSQPESHGGYTRDSPETKFLARRLYAHKSRVLSDHGVLAEGVEGEEWESSRQTYRESLDVIGATTLKELDLNPNPPSSRVAILDIPARTLDPPNLQNRLLPPGPAINFSRPRIPLQRRLTDLPTNAGHAPSNAENLPPTFINMIQRPASKIIPHSVSFPSLAPQAYAQQLGMSRYTAEFEEEAVIGKGAYGEVYRVRNHVDGQLYAVKKIPLSARRLKQLQEGGMPELDNILKEIRTLARLEHQNVVRYFAAWAEYSKSPRTPMSADFSAAVARMTGRPPAPTSLLRQVSANEDVSISITLEEESNQGIVFEESGSHIVFGDSSVSGVAALPSTTNPIPEASTSPEVENAGNSEEASGDDDEGEIDEEEEDVESISRRLTQSQMLSSSEADDDIFSDGLGGVRSQTQFNRPLAVDTQLPSITLHIQMSLHPLNLAQYLSPQLAGPNIASNPHHCFHLLPSLRIIFGILAGVEYLHIKGIIHRDLKPANVFLSLPDGNVDKGSDKCSACEATGHCPPCYTVPRIGDFGLVADISPLDEKPSDAESARPVGTEFYRPPAMPTRSRRSSSAQQPMESPLVEEEEEAELVPTPDESLDVFALGVILFELLYKLDTRMERQMVLSELTCSRNCRDRPKLPDDFKRTVEKCVRTSCHSSSDKLEGDLSRIPEHITRCILGMVEPEARRRWTCKEVRRCLEEVFAIVRENGSA